MARRWILVGGFALAAASVAFVGCNNSQQPATEKSGPQTGEAKSTGSKEAVHPHKSGAHGGIIVSLGADSYHAEAVFENGRKVRLYMLGKEETRVQEVDTQELTAFATAEGATEAVPLMFKAEPQAGDSKGKTSLFVATLPETLTGKKVQITITNLTVGGERFRIGFGNETPAHGEGTKPVKKPTAEETKLFFTPGGLYTAADIKANGDAIPAARYHGIRPTHDSKPKPGDRICPVSGSLANPTFVWVIGGKTYQFCCVPCIEEFVTTAKEKPAEVKDPAEYVKK